MYAIEMTTTTAARRAIPRSWLAMIYELHRKEITYQDEGSLGMLGTYLLLVFCMRFLLRSSEEKVE